MTLISLDTQIRDFTSGIDQSPCNGCDECGTRCTAGIQVLRGEYEAAVAELQRLPADEVERVLGQQKQRPIPGTEESYTACEFRDTERRRCLIYPARPMICRLFGHVEWLPCPIFKVEKLVPGAIELMQSYAAEPRKTFAEWAEADGLPWPPVRLARPHLECGGSTPLFSLSRGEEALPVGTIAPVTQGSPQHAVKCEPAAGQESGVEPPHFKEGCPAHLLTIE
jgi:Fe-S-cluster containining protein